MYSGVSRLERVREYLEDARSEGNPSRIARYERELANIEAAIEWQRRVWYGPPTQKLGALNCFVDFSTNEGVAIEYRDMKRQ